METTTSHLDTGAGAKTLFHNFSRLPPEIRDYIWTYAVPGPRLIEVYNLPIGRYNGPDGCTIYGWCATQCKCPRRCNRPLAVSQTCREAQAIAHRDGPYSKCFGTWVNWAIDTIYIGERVGHLHNTGFLKAAAEGGGLEKLKHLAIEDSVLNETYIMHGRDYRRFKRCSASGMLVKLRGLISLTIVGQATWRDGNELFEDPDYERDWIYGDISSSESEQEDTDEETDLAAGELWRPQVPLVVDALHRQAKRTNKHNRPKSHWSDDDSESSEEWLGGDLYSTDPWECAEYTATEMQCHLDYKHSTSDKDARRFGHNGECGLALVPFKDIKGDKDEIVWGLSYEATDIKAKLEQEFRQVKRDRTPQSERDDDPQSHNFEDYAAWKSPVIQMALFRKTAKSCCQSDWVGLNRDYMSLEEGRRAKLEPEAYKRRDKSLDYLVTIERGNW